VDGIMSCEAMRDCSDVNKVAGVDETEETAETA